MATEDTMLKKKPEDVVQAHPQARDQTADMARMLKDAKISRVTPVEKSNEDVKRMAMHQLFEGFFSACQDAAQKQGTARAFAGSEMKQLFG
jgi:phosphoribosylanthranilate isomerase